MKALFVLITCAVLNLSANARIVELLSCSDELTSVSIRTQGFAKKNYDVMITDLRTTEVIAYEASYNQKGSFVAVDEEGEGVTINIDHFEDDIAFVKGGWGLVILEDCVFSQVLRGMLKF